MDQDIRTKTGVFEGVGFWPTGETGPAGRPMWCVVGGDLAYKSRLLGRVVVREGFVFDGPSIPWIVAWALPTGSMFLASAVHDWLLDRTVWEKPLCDQVFLEALNASGTPAWAARVSYWAVGTKKTRT